VCWKNTKPTVTDCSLGCHLFAQRLTLPYFQQEKEKEKKILTNYKQVKKERKNKIK
jgi:predicted metal-binding protein